MIRFVAFFAEHSLCVMSWRAYSYRPLSFPQLNSLSLSIVRLVRWRKTCRIRLSRTPITSARARCAMNEVAKRSTPFFQKLSLVGRFTATRVCIVVVFPPTSGRARAHRPKGVLVARGERRQSAQLAFLCGRPLRRLCVRGCACFSSETPRARAPRRSEDLDVGVARRRGSLVPASSSLCLERSNLSAVNVSSPSPSSLRHPLFPADSLFLSRSSSYFIYLLFFLFRLPRSVPGAAASANIFA